MSSNAAATYGTAENDSPTAIISAAGLSKCYHIYERPQDRLRQFLFGRKRRFYREFWALQPLSFSVERGECVGFVGRNGSGKSTLLQILAGILTPSGGSATINGRVAALLELGAGFNPEFTGRENVFLNAAILGLSYNEIVERLPAIEAFAEIGSFINEPVKTYSSGMYVRLAFSVAIHVDPEILIVDEALSVGDAAFQYKCLRRIEELQDRGTSIILVTHDSGVVKRFCSRAGWIHEGRLISFGPAVEIVNQYDDFCRQQMKIPALPGSETTGQGVVQTAPGQLAAVRLTQTGSTPASQTSRETPHVAITAVELCDHNGAANQVFVLGSTVMLRVRYRVEVGAPDGFVFGAAVYRKDDLYVCGLNTFLDQQPVDSDVGEHELRLIYEECGLLPGSYYFKVGMFDGSGTVRWDFLHSACEFSVAGPYRADGVVLLKHAWRKS